MQFFGGGHGWWSARSQGMKSDLVKSCSNSPRLRGDLGQIFFLRSRADHQTLDSFIVISSMMSGWPRSKSYIFGRFLIY